MTKKYNDCIGFTEKETRKILNYYGLKLTEEVKEYYEGYNFGGLMVYNPWDMINYAFDKRLYPSWCDTAGIGLLKEMFKGINEYDKIEIEKLILGESICINYDNAISYSNLKNNLENANIVFNLLLATGYLTFDKTIYNEISDMKISYFKVPNKQIRKEFEKVVKRVSCLNVGSKIENRIEDALLDNDKEQLEYNINYEVLQIEKYNFKELFHNDYILRLFYPFINSVFRMKIDKNIRAEKYDLMIERKDKSIGIVIEIKIADKKEEMEDLAMKVLAQIQKQEYYKELELEEVKNINKYSIVFYGKECIVRG